MSIIHPLISEVIIEKHYRGLLNRNICDYFWDEVKQSAKSR
jgi:hypothetical protein